MPRDTHTLMPMLTDIEALIAPLLENDLANRLADPRRRVSATDKTRLQARAAFQASGASDDAQRVLEEANKASKSARTEIARIEREAIAHADAAVPALAQIVSDLAELARSLADGMRQVAEHTHRIGSPPHPLRAWSRWAEADASARGLAALAAEIGRTR